MNGILMRQDPALRHIGKWVAMSLVTAALVMNLIMYRFADRGSEPSFDAIRDIFVALAWLLVSIYLAFGKVRTRASNFGMMLPVPSASLWRAHVSAVVTGAVSLLLAAVAVVIV